MPEKKYKKEVHSCPFCDAEIAKASFPYCEACKVTILTCPECKKQSEMSTLQWWANNR